MNSSIKRRRLVSVVVVGVVLLIVGQYLFVPFASPAYDFSDDLKAIEEKRQFLSSKRSAVSLEPISSKPNIVILVADDLGKMDISLYGNRNVQTPNIDSLALAGVKFTSGYVTAAICSPSRAGLLTGRYQQRFGHELQPVSRYPKNNFEKILANWLVDRQQLEFSDNDKIPTSQSISKQGLPLGEITIAELLKRNGYSTGVIGKWHLGADEEHRPLQRGFDYHYGFYQAFSWYADTTDREIINVRHKGIMDSYIWDRGREGDALIRRGTEILDEKEYLTDKLAQEAIGFIDRNKEKPFLLYVPFNAPHTPFQARKQEVKKFESKGLDRNHAVYYAMIESLDRAVGAIHDKVKATGLEEQTLIFFLSDNGGATYTDATTNAPLKGGKFSLYEGGINVPFIAKWKGHIPSGTVYEAPVSSLDIFVTAAGAANASLPPGRLYDGVNLLPFLTRADASRPHETLFWRSGSNKAVRKGDWKLVINETDNVVALYDLRADKEERTNLAQTLPDKVAELREALIGWEKELVPPLWPSTGFYRNEFEGVVDRFTL